MKKQPEFQKCPCPSDEDCKQLEQRFNGLFRVARARGLTFDELKTLALGYCDTELIRLNITQIRLLTVAIDVAGRECNLLK